MNNVVNLYEFFNSVVEKDKLNHAYLISNAKLCEIKENLNEIISKFYLNSYIDIENDENIYLILPEKNVIKKEQIKELETKILTTSQTSNKKIYIIDECDKLNSYSANALLKTLEEPEKNIYAILLTKNLEKVMLTIKSRCQILYCKRKEEKIELEEEFLNIANQMLENLEVNKEKTIAYENKIYKTFDKEKLKKLLIYFEYTYSRCLDYKINKIEEENLKSIEIKIINNNDINQIIKKLDTINKINDLLEYNLNLNLLIDRFIIDFGRE